MRTISRKTLIIHPRRGLFQLTFCRSCGHTFQCQQCDANLVTYRAGNSLELICHQCQSYYKYPNQCPTCASLEITSRFGGVDDLREKLKMNSQQEHDAKKDNETANTDVEITTRLFDPSINYSQYEQVIIARAEHLNASPDYLVQEETAKQLSELLLALPATCRVILDIPTGYQDVFEYVKPLISGSDGDTNGVVENTAASLLNHHQHFLNEESAMRLRFGFPPHQNLLLFTTQEKKKEISWQKITEAKKQLEGYGFEQVTISSPYPARFLKRKGMFSYHLLVKYPRQYEHFAKLRTAVLQISSLYRIQTRLNPRHLF